MRWNAVRASVAAMLMAGSTAASARESPGPLNLEQTRKLVLLPAPDAVVSGEIASRGIDFEPTESTVSTLQKVGAGKQTLAALRSIRANIDGGHGAHAGSTHAAGSPTS